MFPESTQATQWMFSSAEAINLLRARTHQGFIDRHGDEVMSDDELAKFLTQEEEWSLVYHFSLKLAEFCAKFKPPMPRYVRGTSFHYFKRFYLHNSVMDHHPKDILVTAVYLACKTEEFNVSMQQFVANIAGNQERATQIILNNELLLMQELHFHLTIHNPFRAVEGLLIDIKTRAGLPQGVTAGDVEQFRPEIDSFLDKVFLTDAFLIYAPSQIALAAVIHAASKNKINLDSYVTQQLFDSQGQEAITHIVTIVRNIRVLVKNIPEPSPEKDKELIRSLCGKVDKCRNQENNPDSQAYKRKLEAMVDEEEMLAELGGKKARVENFSGIQVLSPPVS